MSVEQKMSSEKARDVECLLKTLDRMSLMPPYLVTAEIHPKIVWCGEGGSGEVDFKHIMTIRVVGEKIYYVEIERDDV